MSWHLAPSLVRLQKDLDAVFGENRPNDGTIGDAAHAARQSEHNPDRDSDGMPNGAVSAIDIYTEANGKTWITDAEFAKFLAVLKKDSRVWYVIHKEHIYSVKHGWVKTKYNGANPHNTHIHISLLQTKAAHDDVSSWKLEGIRGSAPKPKPEPKPKPTLVKLDPKVKPGTNHPQVKLLQKLLVAAGFPIRGSVTAYYGVNTQEAVIKFHNKYPEFKDAGVKRDPYIGPKGFEFLQKLAEK